MTNRETLEQIEAQRKRLIFRSWHRGTREMDLLLGTFADRNVPGFSLEEITLYEEILVLSDPDLYGWITGKEEVPANYVNPVMEKLQAHRFTNPDQY